MKDEERESYERQVKEANDIKAVIGSKGWKETIQPRLIMERDRIIINGKKGISSEIFTDEQGKTRELIKINPHDPHCAARALWMVDGIDTVLQMFDSIITAGEQAKYILKKSDTITKID